MTERQNSSEKQDSKETNVCVSCFGTGIVRIVTTKQLATLVFVQQREKVSMTFFLQPEKYNRFNRYL